jgi:hypothetical protein
MAFRAASISAAISIFSAPGADTRLRAGDVPAAMTKSAELLGPDKKRKTA